MKKFIATLITLTVISCAAALLCACEGSFGGTGGGGGSTAEKTDLTSPLIGYRLTSDPDPVYDGTPKTRAFVITYDGGRVAQSTGTASDANFDIEYSNNVNAGIASAKVTAKPSSSFTGSLIINFEILPSDEEQMVTSFSELERYASSGNYSSVSLRSDIEIAEGESVTISSVCTLDCAGFSFINNGTVTNEGEITISQKSDGEKCEVYSYGSFFNAGKIFMRDETVFFNCGTFENSGNVNFSVASSAFYSDGEVSGSGKMSACYNRRPLEESDIILSFYSATYTGRAVCPDVSVFSEGKKINQSNEYSYSYFDNLYAGEASVKVTMDKYSRYFTGEQTINFTIDRAEIAVYDEASLKKAISSESCYKITIANLSRAVEDDITIPEYLTVVVEQTSGNAIKGDITVCGTLSVTGAMIHSGNMINCGSVTVAGSARLEGNCENNGSWENSGEMTNEGQFVNNENFANGGTFINKGSFSNFGQTDCVGEIFNYDGAQMQTDKTVQIAGKLYTDQAPAMFEGGVVVRSQITEEDVSLEQSSVVYDGKSQYASLVFKASNVPYATYSVSYARSDGTPLSGRPVDAGAYEVIITFNGGSKLYKGSLSLDYTVERAPYEITAIADLSKLEDNNYGELTLIADMELTQEIHISSWQKFIVAEGVSLVNKSPSFYVVGQLEINGSFVNYAEENVIETASGSRIINNGTLYLNAQTEGIEGEGVIYVRRDISTLVSSVSDPFVIYDEQGTPKPKITVYDGAYVLTNEDYSVNYENWREISLPDNKAKIISSVPTFSTKYFGVKVDEYEVRGGSAEVSTAEELIAALANVRSGSQLCNYSTVTMTADITAVNDTYNVITITVCSNTVLNIGSYKLNFRDGEKLKGFKVVNNGEIIIDGENTLRSSSLYSGSGKVVLYAESADDIYDFANYADTIRLSADIEGSITLYPYSNFSKEFDLCGHSVGSFTVNASWCDILITSSVGGASIGKSGSSVAALNVSGVGSQKTITLEELTIYGIKYSDASYSQSVNVDVSCNVVPVA